MDDVSRTEQINSLVASARRDADNMDMFIVDAERRLLDRVSLENRVIKEIADCNDGNRTIDLHFALEAIRIEKRYAERLLEHARTMRDIRLDRWNDYVDMGR